jgi:DNA-binding response OmpR family regulator
VNFIYKHLIYVFEDRSMQGRVIVLDNKHQSVSLLTQVLSHLDVAGYASLSDYFAAGNNDADCFVLDSSCLGEEEKCIVRELRSRPETASTPVIYVGENQALETRLAVYEAGVDDYITAPFDITQLQTKVSRALHQRRYERELLSSAEVARQAAFEAMTHSAEQGEIVRFMEQISMCHKLEELAQAMLGLLSRFGLNVVFSCWKTNDDWPRYFSHAGATTPLEEDLMQSGHTGGRIMEFGRRMLVNYPQASLFVKNVPYEDEARYGRIKDHLCVVLSAADARVGSLNMEEQLREKDKLLSVVNDAEHRLHEFRENQSAMLSRVAHERADLKIELREELLMLSLNDEQEERMLNLVEDHMNSLDGLYREAIDWQEAIEPAMQALQYVVRGNARPDGI